MYFLDKIKEYKEELVIFVDMDGVITDYNFKGKLDFKAKRPLLTNINTLKEVSKLKNVELHILSICIKNSEIKEKNDWLDKYAPYFKERTIIPKESDPNSSSKELKCNYLKQYKTNKKIIHIDDDNDVLDYLYKNIDNITLFQDSSLID